MIEPMLAEKGEAAFNDDNYFWETKFDGARCLAYIQDGRVILRARSGADHTSTFPELQGLHQQVNAREAVLDGELVVERDGDFDFRALQSRIHRTKALAIRMASQASPATYMVFDVLRVNDQDLTANGQRIPLEMRKALLAKLLEPSDRCRAVEYRIGNGVDLFDEVIGAGQEGVMAKDRSGLYYPGARHVAWLKVKGIKEDSFLVCGYTQGEGWRDGLFGALLLGKVEGGVLRYCGAVGTGFKVADLAEVYAQIQNWHTQKCPFPKSPNEPKLFSYLEPRLVVDVKYHEETLDGKLRFPVFLRLRPDLQVAP